ncbi:MAG: membrane fusion protein (multidrug efflux system) [Gammaproteobacteria bacterium]|jgi:membrane fusion protein (multidrug efflux system)
MFRLRVFIPLIFGSVLSGVAHAQSSTTGAASLPNVLVSMVRKANVTANIQQVGRVKAVDRVELRARVSGVLEQRLFEEGRLVNKAQVLFQLERAPYLVVVDQFKADLEGARASLKKADADLARSKSLRARNTLAAADLDTAIADRAIARANVLRAQAALAKANLDLGYTEIRSPISGRISIASYSVGNLITPESGTLATVTSVDPVYIDIAVSAKRILVARRDGIDLDNPTVKPFLKLADGSEYQRDGRFVYLSPEVDTGTDTMTGRAEFPNPDGLLVPGDFVTVTVRSTRPKFALVVPQAAVQRDKAGYFVLIVDAASKVEKRLIRTGPTIAGEWTVLDGLSEGETIIVQGVSKVRPGMSVKTTATGKDEPPTASSGG